MMDDGSWAWWGPGVLFMAFCMVMMVWMMSGHGSDGSHRAVGGAPRDQGSGGPERVLAERLARGEIDVEEYERRLRVLQQRGGLHRPPGGIPDG